jgi:hypothetical protein
MGLRQVFLRRKKPSEIFWREKFSQLLHAEVFLSLPTDVIPSVAKDLHAIGKSGGDTSASQPKTPRWHVSHAMHDRSG